MRRASPAATALLLIDAPGTPGWEIHPDLAPQAGDAVIQKWTPDSFHETALLDTLHARGTGVLIIAGMQTEFCVDTTTRRAADLGFAVTLVADGHSTYDAPGRTAAELVEHHNRALGAIAPSSPPTRWTWAPDG